MDLEFRSVEELYQRLLPALRSKKRELDRLGYSYIKEEDIWNVLKQNKWSKSHDLTLSDMVGDILNTGVSTFDSFIKNSLNDRNNKTRPKDLEVL